MNHIVNWQLSKLPIADALGLGVALLLPLVLLIIGVAAFVKDDFGVALEGEDVRADAIEEPAVVRDNNGTSGEGFETFLEGAERVHVDVVRRLVEEEDVGFGLERERQMEAVTLAAREDAATFLLVGTGEVEA